MENSKIENKFDETEKRIEAKYSAITVGGKSLIQICIENEKVNNHFVTKVNTAN